MKQQRIEIDDIIDILTKRLGLYPERCGDEKRETEFSHSSNLDAQGAFVGGGDHHLNHPPSAPDPYYNHHSQYSDQSFYDPNHNPNNYYYNNNIHYPHHYSGNFNGGGAPACGSGHPGSYSGRRRGWHNSNQDNGIKLYVAHVPRTVTEQDIRSLFEQCGNIIEVVLLKDKSTGQQQGSCFVKYGTAVEANKAVVTLNNIYTFPGETAPLLVRYAKEKDRYGMPVHDKLFVANLNKEASKEEIMEIFSQYGVVEDLYTIRDEMKQSRGCGFVKFSNIEMARAAIEGLHGNYSMRGCDPLVVRFAEPKKPKHGDFRNSNMYGGPNFNHDYPPWQTNNPVDSMWGYNQPEPPYPVQQFSSTSHPHGNFSAPYQEQPSHCYQMPFEQIHGSETSSQSSLQTAQDSQKPVHLIPTNENVEQPQWSQPSKQQPPSTGVSPRAVASNLTLSPVSSISQSTESPECDWSEHTCPDGFKYYYNCITCESLWDKPKEFALFEEEIVKQRQQQNPSNPIQPPSPILSTQNLTEPVDTEKQTHILNEELQLEKPPILMPDQVEVQ